jgi:hypothetical protein
MVRGAVLAQPDPGSRRQCDGVFAIGERLHREAQRGAPEVRHGRQVRPRARAMRSKRDRAEPVTAVSAPKSTSAPQSVACCPVAVRRVGGGAPLAGEQRLHRFGQPGLLVAQLEVHDLLLGQAEDAVGDDVALDLRPPYTVAARE